MSGGIDDGDSDRLAQILVRGLIDPSMIDDQTPSIADIIRIGNAREYRKHEFCKAINCPGICRGNKCHVAMCIHTAKEFHHWLDENGFKIVEAAKGGR